MPHPDTIRLITTIIALLLLLGIGKRPLLGLISYLAIMMLRPGLFFPVLAALRIELLVGVLIIIYIVLSGRINRINLSKDSISKYMFIFFAVMTASMLQAINFTRSWEWLNEFLKVFLFFVMVVTLLEDKHDIEIFLLSFCFLTFIIAYDSVYNYMQGKLIQAVGDFRVDYAVATKGMGAGHVGLANMTLQAMPFAWFVGICNKKIIVKAINVLLFGICFYSVIISGSRGGFVGLVVLWMCLIFFSKNKIPLIVAAVVIFFTLPLFSSSGYMNYISSILSFGGTDVSANSRITGLRHGFEMLLKRPILGVGPGCYPIARKAWFGWGLWSHNIYGELMGDLGVTGTVVWFVFVKNYMSKAWQYLKKVDIDQNTKNIFYAIITATIVRLVLGMGSHSLYIFFWYLLAGVMSVYSSRIFPEELSNSKGSRVLT